MDQEDKQKNEQQANNTKQHIKIVEDYISQGQENCIEYQNQIEVLRGELNASDVQQHQMLEDVKSSLKPMIENTLRELNQAVVLQKEENKRQQISITQLKKKAYEIQQDIQDTDLSAMKLQDVIGDYFQQQEQA